MSSFGMETALRVTIGTPEENRRLIKALKKVLAEGTVG
jgi:histidinol-phosphate/aromatic aminotransferase/cobyric acid decarboxylase-like protein